MKKSELEALGLDAATIKAIQIIHGKDMQVLQAKNSVKAPNEDARSAIAAMLPMIRKKENLTELLMKCTYLYHTENRKERPKNLLTAPVEVLENTGEEAQEDV